MNKTDYPVWDVDLFPNSILREETSLAVKLKKIRICPEIIAALILGCPIYGDAEACLRAKAIFLTTDNDICILHPVNDDEDEMVIRLSYDKVKAIWREND